MSVKEKEYWDEWYKERSFSPPSHFAIFCESIFFPPKCHVIDAGCGNGRDSIYFQSRCHNVFSVDVSGSGNGLENFFRGDACNFSYDCDVVYSRWFLHALDEEGETDFLASVGKSKNKMVCIECRSFRDTDDILKDHYRRPICKSVLREKIKNLGFKILFCGESRGWSPTKESDPLLIRVIGKRN